jgi:hypothetical protein
MLECDEGLLRGPFFCLLVAALFTYVLLAVPAAGSYY